MSGVQSVGNQLRFDPVGECIYCGSRVNLSDEHIVPLALGGRLILPAASCDACAAITSAFERRVLRGFMFRARVAGRFPTRRPKERPSTLPVHLLGENQGVVHMPAAEAPVFLQLPLLDEAGYLRGKATVAGTRIKGLETLLFGGRPEHLMKEGVTGMRQVDDHDVTSFARMIAKIGYSYFIGVGGLVDRRSVPVLPLIMGQADDASQWLGSRHFETQAEKQGAIHVLSLLEGEAVSSQGYETPTLARVKLFASAGATGFEVVVQRKGTTPPML